GGLELSFAAVLCLHGPPNVSTITLCGDSAGDNFAAAIALGASECWRDDVALQLLIYPAFDPGLREPSMENLATGYGLTQEDMRCFWDMYLQSPADAFNPHASPLRAGDLAGVAPAFILTAEYDPLVDEGERYARLLQQSGVQVT